jgi:maleylacetoacetate isomerase
MRRSPMKVDHPLMILRGYFRSSTTYRVRIALNLKGLSYLQEPVNLLNRANHAPEFRAINSFGSVPALTIDGEHYAQSLAIIEMLDERWPAPAFLPAASCPRTKAREWAFAIATELHAPMNLPVLNNLKDELGQEQAGVTRWCHRWLERTLAPIEAELAKWPGLPNMAGPLPFGAPSLFEIMLVPQLYNARRFDFDLSAYPSMMAADEAARAHPAFVAAHPDNQPDARP